MRRQHGGGGPTGRRSPRSGGRGQEGEGQGPLLDQLVDGSGEAALGLCGEGQAGDDAPLAVLLLGGGGWGEGGWLVG